MPDDTKKEEIKIAVNRDMLKGVYANQMRVQHSNNEFVFDFMFITPPEGTLTARVVVSPAMVKGIQEALADNISRYEKTYGDIKKVVEKKYEIGFQSQS